MISMVKKMKDSAAKKVLTGEIKPQDASAFIDAGEKVSDEIIVERCKAWLESRK